MRRSRKEHGERGQALVEFAITAPLMVMIMLFAIWFYELVHVKLKVQEAARFLAWETTAYPMHDYMAGFAASLPIPTPDMPSFDLGAVLGTGAGGLSAAATEAANDQISAHLNNLIPFGGFGMSAVAVGAASAETMLRYRDMNSATLLPRATDMLAASWEQPIAFGIDQMEEPIYGGPLINLLASFAGTLFDVFSSMTYSNSNYVAKSLIATGKGFGGVRSARIFGAPEWGFNRRGYIKSMTAVVVNNEWFMTGVGRMILPNAGVMLRENNGVLADSWRMNTDAIPGLDRMNIGFSTTPLNAQVKRMYMVTWKGKATWAAHVAKLLATATSILTDIKAMVMIEPKDTFTKASAISRPYKQAPLMGKVEMLQDMPIYSWYHTAPFEGQYFRTWLQRGEFFMGCRQPMALGCTDSLMQDNPFGDYLVRN